MDKTQLWGTSVVERPCGVEASGFETKQADACSSFFVLLFIVCMMIVSKHIRHSLEMVARCCFRFGQTMKAEDNLSLEQGRIILFLVGLFHFSMVSFYFLKAFRGDLYQAYGWWIVPGFYLFSALFYLCRRAVFAFIGWTIRRPNELAFMAKGLRDFLIFGAALTLSISFFNLFADPFAAKPFAVVMVSVLAFCYLLFLFRTFRYFIYVRFSIFFWILYLCGLEIAPLALLYGVLITV